MGGLVDDTSDVNKPVSTATQPALNLNANLANPTFTGTVLAPTVNATTSIQENGVDIHTMFLKRPWVQCVVNTNGTICANSSVGQITPTIGRTSGESAGAWDINSTSHPTGVPYAHYVQVRTDSGLGFGVVSNIVSNSCKVRLYSSSQVLTDCQFSLVIVS